MLHDFAHSLNIRPAIVDLIAVGTVLLISLVLGVVLNRVFHHWTQKLQGRFGELMFALLESLPLPLLLLTGLYASLEIFDLPRKWELIGSKLIVALVIIVLCYFPAKILMLFLRRAGEKNPYLAQATTPAALVVRVLFALIAVAIILENLGVHLTAVWTTLGVGSVAVALALQETLSNLFAGLYVMADRPIRPGDYIQLDSGAEGFVLRIGWRSTSLRTRANNLVVVPNSTLAKAVITNYSLPEPRMGFGLQVGVAYGTDPERVEKILLDVFKQAIHDGVEGIVTEAEPSVLLNPGFGNSSLNFTLGFQIRTSSDQFRVQSELRKRILKRFQQEEIEMPFPIQTVILDKSSWPVATGQEPKS
ncbi:MAG TPA: mechanosensitive ion channel family protein [Terriglobia bacterium]|nr:mechanosensitive ion channel family protein [Terriglobia bacterium]